MWKSKTKRSLTDDVEETVNENQGSFRRQGRGLCDRNYGM